jgi:hypothetical protein
VAGSLVDHLTGIPFGVDHPGHWKVSLLDIKENRFTGSCSSKGRQDRFMLAGIPEGEYQLLVEAEGYDNFQSAAFTLFEGQNLFIGELGMEPCGLLDIEVVDTSQLPIERFILTCDGIRRMPGRRIGEKRRFDKLPVGTVIVTVSARGFLEKSIQLQLEPSHPTTTRIALTPAAPDFR